MTSSNEIPSLGGSMPSSGNACVADSIEDVKVSNKEDNELSTAMLLVVEELARYLGCEDGVKLMVDLEFFDAKILQEH